MKKFIGRGKLKKAAISEEMIAKEFNIGVKAVSYTHLDVYKRQAFR